MKIFLLSLSIVVFCGCVSASKMNRELDSWIDEEKTTVITSWGKPDKIVDQDGFSALTYLGDKCEVTFGFGKDNKVKSANWRGNKYKCNKQVRPSPNY